MEKKREEKKEEEKKGDVISCGIGSQSRSHDHA